MGVIERAAEGLSLAYDFAGHKHVNLAGAPRRSAFCTALVQVQVAPELLVVTRLGRRPVFRLPLLNVGVVVGILVC